MNNNLNNLSLEKNNKSFIKKFLFLINHTTIPVSMAIYYLLWVILSYPENMIKTSIDKNKELVNKTLSIKKDLNNNLKSPVQEEDSSKLTEILKQIWLDINSIKDNLENFSGNIERIKTSITDENTEFFISFYKKYIWDNKNLPTDITEIIFEILQLIIALNISYELWRIRFTLSERITINKNDISTEEISEFDRYRKISWFQSYADAKKLYYLIRKEWHWAKISRNWYKHFFMNNWFEEWQKYTVNDSKQTVKHKTIKKDFNDFTYYLEEEWFTIDNIKINEE